MANCAVQPRLFRSRYAAIFDPLPRAADAACLCTSPIHLGTRKTVAAKLGRVTIKAG